MDTVNLSAFNTEPFVFARVLSGWGALYDLTTGKIRMQMRPTPDSTTLLYELSTDNSRIARVLAPAVGTLQFPNNPVAGDVILCGNTTVSFVASGASGLQVNVGASAPATLANALTFLNGSADSEIAKATYSRSLNALTAVFKTTGDSGNRFAFGSSTNGVVAAGDTLLNGGTLLTFTAPIADISTFEVGKAFSYDVRYEDDAGPEVILFGGTITFAQGVTR